MFRRYPLYSLLRQVRGDGPCRGRRSMDSLASASKILVKDPGPSLLDFFRKGRCPDNFLRHLSTKTVCRPDSRYYLHGLNSGLRQLWMPLYGIAALLLEGQVIAAYRNLSQFFFDCFQRCPCINQSPKAHVPAYPGRTNQNRLSSNSPSVSGYFT